jgi:hypothetical protein
MTHQVMNGSFGKVLAAAALGFMLSSAAPVQAQQGWGSDNCFYARGQGGQMVRLGCVRALRGHLVYHNFGTNVLTDLSTNFSYLPGQGTSREDLAPQAGGSQIRTHSRDLLENSLRETNQRINDRYLAPNCNSSYYGCR